MMDALAVNVTRNSPGYPTLSKYSRSNVGSGISSKPTTLAAISNTTAICHRNTNRRTRPAVRPPAPVKPSQSFVPN